LSLSDRFNELAKLSETQELSLAKIIHWFGAQSHALVIIFLAIPFLFPIPIPGLSFIFGLVIVFSSIGLIFNVEIYLPKKIAHKVISKSLIQSIFSSTAKVVKKIENVIKPRFPYLVQNNFTRIFSGLVILIAALILMLPLPPGTNFPPALVCAVVAFGLLEDDLFTLILGHILFIGLIALSSLLYDYIYSWVISTF
jgi:hypothetical protein